MGYKQGIPLILPLVSKVFPAVDRELVRWRSMAAAIPDGVLRAQALASIEKKRFHCLGGAAFALYPGADLADTVRFVVAFQTISDYLDNLCDRAGVTREAAFRRLHLAMADAVSPHMRPYDYYGFYPHRDDGGYLAALVEECRQRVKRLPSLPIVKEKMWRLVALYSELQALKHTEPALREDRLSAWAAPLAAEYPGVSVWEFCAATGSTLGVFLLFAAAQTPGLTPAEVDFLTNAYFPQVCGLHILLDYFIDAGEDRAEGDFNFTFFYRDAAECAGRLSAFAERSMAVCSELRFHGFHHTVIRGLLAVYLSDPKAAAQKAASTNILHKGGRQARMYCEICRLLRKVNKL